jgi:hypothetical protein
MDKVSKPKSTLALEQSIPNIEDGESSSSRKIYQYIPSDQRKEGDTIFCIINKPPHNRGISLPTLLPPLVQYKIKQAQIKRDNKSKMAT